MKLIGTGKYNGNTIQIVHKRKKTEQNMKYAKQNRKKSTKKKQCASISSDLEWALRTNVSW